MKSQVGFPIRTSRDQRVLSPPPGLSQSATSFIASCCQGIHQTPLSRLIRSRRRRALLRDGGSKPSTHPIAWIRSLDPERTLGRGPPGSSKPRTTPSRRRRIRQSSRSVSFDLERLSWLSLRRAGRRSRARTPAPRQNARTRPNPHSGRTQNVSCFALFTMSSCRMSPSGPCQIVTCRDLAIGQEGSHP